jgi:hypothetical protein
MSGLLSDKASAEPATNSYMSIVERPQNVPQRPHSILDNRLILSGLVLLAICVLIYFVDLVLQKQRRRK